VEALAPGVFVVEFSDNEGRTYASLAVRAEHLMVLIRRRVCKEMHQRAVGGTDRSRCGVNGFHSGMNRLHCSVNGFHSGMNRWRKGVKNPLVGVKGRLTDLESVC